MSTAFSVAVGIAYILFFKANITEVTTNRVCHNGTEDNFGVEKEKHVKNWWFYWIFFIKKETRGTWRWINQSGGFYMFSFLIEELEEMEEKKTDLRENIENRKLENTVRYDSVHIFPLFLSFGTIFFLLFQHLVDSMSSAEEISWSCLSTQTCAKPLLIKLSIREIGIEFAQERRLKAA